MDMKISEVEEGDVICGLSKEERIDGLIDAMRRYKRFGYPSDPPISNKIYFPHLRKES